MGKPIAASVPPLLVIRPSASQRSQRIDRPCSPFLPLPRTNDQVHDETRDQENQHRGRKKTASLVNLGDAKKVKAQLDQSRVQECDRAGDKHFPRSERLIR